MSSMISFNSVQGSLANFIDERIISSIPEDKSFIKWILSGSSVLVLNNLQGMLNKYVPILKEFGIMDEAKNVDIDQVKLFLDNAFKKQPILTIPIMSVPFKFDESDGKALIDILNRYRE